MRRGLVGAFTYVEFGILLLAWLPILGVITLFGRRDLRRRGRWIRRFGRLTARLTPLWRFRVEGVGPRDIAQRPYVVVANHQSTADPWLLSSLPFDMRWVAKIELFRTPFVGWLLRLGGDLAIERGTGTSMRRLLREGRATLDSGLPLMIFPEGTRSRDGAIGPFKDGAFALAIAAGVPIVPVVLDGTRNCRPKGSWWFGDADAVARILEPIPTAGLGPADVPRLRDLVRARIAAELPRLQASMRAHARPARPALTAPSDLTTSKL
jgi:1-acyl-sn-glycerol-3-phosphate acyltransferase